MIRKLARLAVFAAAWLAAFFFVPEGGWGFLLGGFGWAALNWDRVREAHAEGVALGKREAWKR
jgi:hypothetical protein